MPGIRRYWRKVSSGRQRETQVQWKLVHEDRRAHCRYEKTDNLASSCQHFAYIIAVISQHCSPTRDNSHFSGHWTEIRGCAPFNPLVSESKRLARVRVITVRLDCVKIKREEVSALVGIDIKQVRARGDWDSVSFSMREVEGFFGGDHDFFKNLENDVKLHKRTDSYMKSQEQNSNYRLIVTKPGGKLRLSGSLGLILSWKQRDCSVASLKFDANSF